MKAFQDKAPTIMVLVSARITAADRADLVTLAALTGSTVSAVVRELLRAGARARLRTMAAEPPPRELKRS